tara:strand:+ start:11644 stop:13752 length:2109 start_codon:yes stop_codon:yes gene_type:complete
MGGADGLGGYIYQQDYAAFRLLVSEASRLLSKDSREYVASFKIEGRQTAEGPTWDVAWKLEDASVHLRECKNTDITRKDCEVFYSRLRDEIVAGVSANVLTIGWVTDTRKQKTKIIEHLDGMRKLAKGADLTEIGRERPRQVVSAETALADAMYHLWHSGDQEEALSIDLVRQLLSGIQIENYRAEELGNRVELVASTVFEHGAGSTIRKLIQGELSTKIHEVGRADLTITQFFDSLKLDQATMELAGTLKSVLAYHSGRSASTDIQGICWTCRPDAETRRWSLCERLNVVPEVSSFAILAGTGVGKTTASEQMCAAEISHRDPNHVLHIEAGEVDQGVVDSLPALCSVLCGIRDSWIVIDGLDQISERNKQAWRQTMRWLTRIPGLALVVTARQEVVMSHEWMQELLTTLPQIAMEQLSSEQVLDEFARVDLPAPENEAMITCLRNPFLFSIYARTVGDEDLPLQKHGEVTSFNIIEEYWRRRVTATSQGHRISGEENTNAVSKRAAVGFLSKLTLDGNTTFSRVHDAGAVGNGIETLCREGVLIERSTTSVSWSHGWLREFALIDHLQGLLEDVDPRALAQKVCEIGLDSAARVAAVGGVKWIVAHPSIGDVHEYLETLFWSKKSLAREALSVLLEDSPRHLRLASLHPDLIVEALSLARVARLEQWREQVASLPIELFSTARGAELGIAAMRYEMEINE